MANCFKMYLNVIDAANCFKMYLNVIDAVPSMRTVEKEKEDCGEGELKED